MRVGCRISFVRLFVARHRTATLPAVPLGTPYQFSCVGVRGSPKAASGVLACHRLVQPANPFARLAHQGISWRTTRAAQKKARQINLICRA